MIAFDVAEPMGLWIAQWTAKHKQPPSEEQVAEKTRELIEGVAT